MDCTEPEFWEQRYLAGRIPWDQQGVPVSLVAYLRSGRAAGSVLLPGCGSGYEVKAFHEFGWHPVAIDFSTAAIERAREVLGGLAPSLQLADFFAGDFGGGFDLVYERTFLCSLPPDRWAGYASRMAGLLRPGGVLAGIFYHGTDPDGPPFPLDASRAKQLFARFELVADRAIPPEQSLPLFSGYERWQEWQLRPGGERPCTEDCASMAGR